MPETLSRVILSHKQKYRLFLFTTFFAHFREGPRVLCDSRLLISCYERKVCIKVRVKALNSLLTCQLCILHLILLPVITPTKCVLKCGSDSANEPSNDVWLCLLLLSRRTRMTKLNRFFLVNRISHVFICVIGCWCLIS